APTRAIALIQLRLHTQDHIAARRRLLRIARTADVHRDAIAHRRAGELLRGRQYQGRKQILLAQDVAVDRAVGTDGCDRIIAAGAAERDVAVDIDPRLADPVQAVILYQ